MALSHLLALKVIFVKNKNSYSVQYFLLVLIIAVFAAPPHALAQKELRDHVTSYSPDYFARSKPATALEMVQFLPAFQLIESDPTVRGYDAANGNVIIDGKPPASKAEKTSEILKRIPPNSVERIEIIRAGASGIDMQGYALLANVVRKVNSKLRGRIELQYIQNAYGFSSPKLGGQFSIGSDHVLNLSANVHRQYLYNWGNGSRNRYKPLGGTPVFLAQFDHPKVETGYLSSGDYRQLLLGGTITLNVSVSGSRTLGEPVEKEYYPILNETDGTEREIRNNTELGFHYSHNLWVGGDLAIAGIHRASSLNNTQSQKTSISKTEVYTKTDPQETVFSVTENQRGRNWSFQAGAEGSLNTLRNNISYQYNGNEIPLPSANVTVSEQRVEASGVGTWHPLSFFGIEAGARYETSKLIQTGDSSLKKHLSFLKPHALLTFDIKSNDEIRVLYERQVGQLNFNNYVSSVQLSSAQVMGGNPNLLPYSQWRTEVLWEHHFRSGSLVLTARQDSISNVVDRVALKSSAGLFDASGNIKSGKRQEFIASANLPLDWMTLDGVTVRGSWLTRFTHVIDPTTGIRRPINNEAPYEASFNLTEDLPSIHSRWGATYTHEIDSSTYKFNDIRRNDMPEQIDAFFEYKPKPQWLVRLFAENITNRPIDRMKSPFPGTRSNSSQLYIEHEKENPGQRVGLNVQYNFGE